MALEKSLHHSFDLIIPKKDYGYIYHLLDENDQIIYVGQTLNIYSRLSSHILNGKKFIKFFLYEYPCKDLCAQEAKHILKHSPKLNLLLPPNSGWYSFNAYKKINPFMKGKKTKINNLIKKLGISWDFKNYLHESSWLIISNALRGSHE